MILSAAYHTHSCFSMLLKRLVKGFFGLTKLLLSFFSRWGFVRAARVANLSSNFVQVHGVKNQNGKDGYGT